MNAKYFLDTNIMVYSFDATQPGKRARALALIEDALLSGEGMISTQVIQEFLNEATRKFAPPLNTEDCKVYLSKVLGPLCQVYSDQALYESSLETQQATGYSFYDALIVASALRGGYEILYSEDLRADQRIDNLRIVNPFV